MAHLSCAQVPIFNIMRKFDGETVSDDIRMGRRRFRITRLPQFLALHMKRFTKVRNVAVGACVIGSEQEQAGGSAGDSWVHEAAGKKERPRPQLLPSHPPPLPHIFLCSLLLAE